MTDRAWTPIGGQGAAEWLGLGWAEVRTTWLTSEWVEVDES